MFSDYNEVLTVNEVAEILSCGRNTVYALLQQKLLAGFRIGKSNGRIPKASLESYIIKKRRSN